MIKEEYYTENKEYKVEIIKKKLLLNNNIVYIVNIKDILYDNILIQLNLSNIDMLNIIDNIEIFINNDTDIMYSCNNTNSNCINYIIGLSQYYQDGKLVYRYEDYLGKDILTIYSNINCNINKILQFEVSNTIDKILDILYKFYNYNV